MNLVKKLDELEAIASSMGSDATHIEDFQEELARHWMRIRAVLVAAEKATDTENSRVNLDAIDALCDAVRNLNKESK